METNERREAVPETEETNPNAGQTRGATLKQGILYGLVPHIGCIAFIIGSVLGATVLMNMFKPLLLNPYFFHILVLASLAFATVSSALYLRKNGILSLAGAKRKWKYLSVMYGSTIGANLLLFLLIFPLLANVQTVPSAPSITGAAIAGAGASTLTLKVGIPCPGHAPLISGELRSVNGVTGVQFSFPNLFEVNYDPARTSVQQMLSLEVFKTYKASVVDSVQQAGAKSYSQPSGGGGCGGGGGGSCGGGCCGGGT
jgi:uncharacterized membrane protein YgcG